MAVTIPGHSGLSPPSLLTPSPLAGAVPTLRGGCVFPASVTPVKSQFCNSGVACSKQESIKGFELTTWDRMLTCRGACRHVAPCWAPAWCRRTPATPRGCGHKNRTSLVKHNQGCKLETGGCRPRTKGQQSGVLNTRSHGSAHLLWQTQGIEELCTASSQTHWNTYLPPVGFEMLVSPPLLLLPRLPLLPPHLTPPPGPPPANQALCRGQTDVPFIEYAGHLDI